LRRDLYAAAGITDYWTVNLPNRCLEVLRVPVPDVSQPFGYRYDQIQILGTADSVVPLALPGATILVADLLP
jgi:hypothetical protein